MKRAKIHVYTLREISSVKKENRTSVCYILVIEIYTIGFKHFAH